MPQQAVPESLIAYGLIPVYVIGLLILIAVIVSPKSGLFASHNEQLDGQKTYSPGEYAIVIALLLLFIAITFLIRRKSI